MYSNTKDMHKPFDINSSWSSLIRMESKAFYKISILIHKVLVLICMYFAAFPAFL